MKYQWADGFHAPKGIKPESMIEAIDALPTPTPEALLNASKRKRHVLHDHLWSEGDQVWAIRARLDRCRKILGAVEELVIVGGKTIEVRVVEFIRDKNTGAGVWKIMADIMANKELLAAYLFEVERIQEQAMAKVARVRQLLTD